MALLFALVCEVGRGARRRRMGDAADGGDAPDAAPVDDPAQLNGGREGAEDAASAWRALCRRHRWSPRHATHLRTLLSRALLPVVPALAYVVNPAMRARDASARIEAVRSHATEFTLFECLPMAVRTLHPRDDRYRLMDRIGRRFVETMRSVSKGHLQKILQFLYRILFDAAADDRPWGPLCAAGVDDQWLALRALTPADWLRRYDRVVVGERIMGVTLFKRQMYVLSTLYGRILNPDDRVTIPVPRTGGVVCARGVAGIDGGAGSGSDTASSFSSSGSSDADESQRRRRTELRDAVNVLRRRVCKDANAARDGGAPEPAFAFAPAEVRRIVAAAVGTAERLVVWLFLTTGMRIGGLARLRTGPGPYRWGREVPRTAATIEKNGSERVVPLGAAGRILIARWYREDRRAAPPSAFLFPGRGGADRGASTRWIWQLCGRVFARAGLDADRGHAHPHTFRHTFIHYMYMSGATFEQIAKFVGHRSPAVTSGVYGRLRLVDLESNMVGLPWLRDAETRNTRAGNIWNGGWVCICMAKFLVHLQ